MRTLLMSTPSFGIPTLHALIEKGYEVVGVLCQPDKPAGRGLHLRAPAMKVAAQAAGLPVFQPNSLRSPDTLAELAGTHPDLILVAAYGKYIPDEVLRLGPAGALNLHPSLLPRWRGACPVTAAVRAGDRETGVTVHFVVDEMDAGDILGQAALPIGPHDTTGELMHRLAVVGAELYIDIIAGWLAGWITPRAQDHSQACWCDRMTKAQGTIDWTLPAAELARQVQALDPWPGTFTHWRGLSLLVRAAEAWEAWRGDLAPGQVFTTADDYAVATGAGALVLHRVQAAGKRSLPIREFANGRPGFASACLS